MARVTVFTPTFNRKKVLNRVYESLVKQTYRDFEWLIVDDGSTDNTKELIDKYIDIADFKITYKYQKNSGKHVATNNAVGMTNSELFIIADSDDAFVDNALEILVNTWDSVENKKEYKGVICRCFDSASKRPIGISFPKYIFDSNDIDGYFKYKLKFEKWMLFRTEVLREFPFEEHDSGLKFFPETVTWQQMARKYKTRYIDECLREYYRDQSNSVTKKEYNRYRENIYLWKHFINEVFEYFFYDPKIFMKSFIGLSRDGLLNGYSFIKIISIPNSFIKKIFTIILYPLGYFLYKNVKK